MLARRSVGDLRTTPTVTRFDCALGSSSQETLPKLLARRPLGCTCLQHWSYGSYGSYSACGNPGNQWPVPWCVICLVRVQSHPCTSLHATNSATRLVCPQVQRERVRLLAGRCAMHIRHRPVVRSKPACLLSACMSRWMSCLLACSQTGSLASMLLTGAHAHEVATTQHSACLHGPFGLPSLACLAVSTPL